MNNTRVTGQFEPPQNEFEHARGPLNYAYAFWPTTDIPTNIYIYHANSRLNTPVWGSLRSPNDIYTILRGGYRAQFDRIKF